MPTDLLMQKRRFHICQTQKYKRCIDIEWLNFCSSILPPALYFDVIVGVNVYALM